MSEINSLIFYIVSFIISSMIITKVGNIYKSEDSNKNVNKIKIIIYTIIGLGIPILIASLRYNVGTDYRNYVDLYKIYSNLSIQETFSSNLEIFFLIIIKMSYFFNDYQMMFAIFSFLTVLILYRVIYEYKEKLSLGFMFFLYLFLYYTTSFNIIRQALAVVIVAYSYKFILNREFKKFLITILIASMFHATALFFIPCYFVNLSNVKRKKIIRSIYLICLILIVANYNIIINLISNIGMFEKYELYSIAQDSANMEFIINSIILFVILLFRKFLVKYDERNELFIFFSIVNTILLFTGYFSPFVKRIAMYFGISNIFLLASLPHITKNKQQKLFVYVLIIFYAILMFIFTVYVFKQGNIIPYNTIWER